MLEEVRHADKKRKKDVRLTVAKLKTILASGDIVGSDLHAMFWVELKKH